MLALYGMFPLKSMQGRTSLASPLIQAFLPSNIQHEACKQCRPFGQSGRDDIFSDCMGIVTYGAQPSSVGMPKAEVKFPSLPPPVPASSSLFLFLCRLVSQPEEAEVFSFLSMGGLFNPPSTDERSWGRKASSSSCSTAAFQPHPWPPLLRRHLRPLVRQLHWTGYLPSPHLR